VCAAESSAEERPPSAADAPKLQARPKRPLTAYMFFCQQKRQEVKEV
jgi:hypothetical protein